MGGKGLLWRRGAWAGVVALLAATVVPGAVSTADPVDPQAPPTTEAVGALTGRIAGADRYASAVQISRWRYADPAAADVVYLARGDIFADALTAGSLSDGPVLLTRGGCGGVPGAVLQEIERLDPDQVIALGGPLAVCDEALQAAAQGRPTDRIGGAPARRPRRSSRCAPTRPVRRGSTSPAGRSPRTPSSAARSRTAPCC